MCGRFVQISPGSVLSTLLGLREEIRRAPTYNLAPTQQLLAGRRDEDGRAEAVSLRWGLVPFWSKEPGIGARMINARAETVATKPAFRAALRRRRCVVPAEGFYEWVRDGDRKRPHFIHPGDPERAFLFAGLWERWERGAETLESATIVTCTANAALEGLHDRMPVILDEEAALRWIDPGADDFLALLRSCPDDWIAVREVSRLVNNPRNDSPECLRPAGEGRGLFDAGEEP